MELSSPKLKNLLIFQEETCKAWKEKKKKVCSEEISFSYDVFATFEAVKHREILCKAKVQHRDIT